MSDWTNLAEEAKENTVARGPRCSVAQMLDELEPEAADVVEAVLANKILTNTGIWRSLVKRLGDKNAASLWSIGNHRRGHCRCGR